MEERPVNTDYTFRWFLQAGLGILLILLLGVHLIANHLIAPQGLRSYEEVIRYFKVPGIAWMEMLLLVVVTAHCLLGIYTIVLDLGLASSLKAFCKWMLILACVLTILYGSRLTWLIGSL